MPTPKLKLVQPNPDPHMNIVLYAEAKTGKTVAAASAPKPLLMVNADRPNATQAAHQRYEFDEVHAEGLQTLIDVIEVGRSGDYETIVVDTVGELYRIVLEDLSNRALRPQIQNFGDTGTHIERFCRALVELPLNVVFVLHENKVKDEESGVLERLPFTGTKNPVLAEKLMAMVDVIGYTGIARDPESKEVRYVAQLENGGGRRGGSRWDLGRSRELDLSEWIEAIKEPQKKAA